MADVLFLQSPLLTDAGFVHGFSTRRGGVSSPPWDSLDCSPSTGDDPAAVEENLRLLAAAAGLRRSALRGALQVHGERVHWVEEEDRPGVEADALASSIPGLVPAIKTADCVPILLADEATGLVAAVHAGWRGTDRTVVVRAVEALVEAGAEASRLLAAIGPAIGPCCYEVSQEIVDRFVAREGPAVARGRHLDLQATNRLQLLRAGLHKAHVEVLARCTSCEPDLFFSHRRDVGRTGRHLSFIAAGRPGSLS